MLDSRVIAKSIKSKVYDSSANYPRVTLIKEKKNKYTVTIDTYCSFDKPHVISPDWKYFILFDILNVKKQYTLLPTMFAKQSYKTLEEAISVANALVILPNEAFRPLYE